MALSRESAMTQILPDKLAAPSVGAAGRFRATVLRGPPVGVRAPLRLSCAGPLSREREASRRTEGGRTAGPSGQTERGVTFMTDAMSRRAARARLDYGRAIETLRTSRGLSREELARLARISRSYLHEVERGLKRPSADVLARVATALGVGSAALMQFVEEISAPPEDDRPAAVQLSLRGRPLPLFEPGEAGSRDSGSPDRDALTVAELLVIARRLSPSDRAALLALARHLLTRSRVGNG